MMVMGRDGKFWADAWPPMVINTANAAQIALRKTFLPETFFVIGADLRGNSSIRPHGEEARERRLEPCSPAGATHPSRRITS
jgi:hypothetical protein